MNNLATLKQKLCVQCRKCCEKVGVYTDPRIYEMSKADIIHFYESRGATVSESDQELFIVFDIPCPHLSAKGCAIYKNRPKICRKYSGLHEFGHDCLWSTIPKAKASGGYKKGGTVKTTARKK